MTETKVIKRLDIELLDWEFDKETGALEINYFKGIRVEKLRLSKNELLECLDRKFIIDAYVGEEVKFSRTYEEFSAGRLRQVKNTYNCDLVDFMEEIFGEEEALKLVLFHEEQQEIKRTAKHIADKVQHIIKGFKPQL